MLQQKTYGQAGKTNPQITTTNDTTVGKRKSGDPFAVLPPDIERLTWFGERADISPDNKRVAFMSKSFGDAMVIDLQIRRISRSRDNELWYPGNAPVMGIDLISMQVTNFSKAPGTYQVLSYT